MTHLLDSNACIDHLRLGATSRVAAKLATMLVGNVVICSVVRAELIYGARRSADPVRALTQVEAFCLPFASLPFDDSSADAFGLIKADLFARSTPIGPNDLMIASIALANNLTLVTHNTIEFGRVRGLRIADWQ